MNKRITSLLLLSLTVACSRKEESAAGPTTVASIAAPTTLSSAAAPAAGRAADEVEMRSLLAKWNAALSDHKADALGELYAARVDLYGNEKPRDAIVSAKRKTLAHVKDYSQTVDGGTFDWSDEAKPIVRFEKKWSQNGKQKSVQASLRFVKESGKWRIAGESDAATEKRAKEAAAVNQTREACTSAIETLVSSTKEAKELLKSGKYAAIAEPDENFSTYSVRIAEENDGHRATIAWFEVDSWAMDVYALDPGGQRLPKALVVEPKKLEAAKSTCPID